MVILSSCCTTTRYTEEEVFATIDIKMLCASTRRVPVRLDEMLVDDTAEVELSIGASSFLSTCGRNSINESCSLAARSLSSSPSRDSYSKTPHRKHLWVPPPLTISETNPRRPVKLSTLARVIKDDAAPDEAKGTALFETAIHCKDGKRIFDESWEKALSTAPALEVPFFVQLAGEHLCHYRQHRPRIFRHSYHTNLCDENDKVLMPHICYFPWAVQGMYDAIDDPGFTPCSVPCQAAPFALFPCSWPLFCCAQAYVLRSKLNLIFGVRESYHLLAKSLFCPFCLTASMHREIELRRVPVLIRMPFSSAPQRVYESELLAPDIAHMRVCGELVIPLPSVNENSCESSAPSTLPPPSAECGCLSLRASAMYNSLRHALLIALSCTPYVALMFALGPFALVYHAVTGCNCSIIKCSSSCWRKLVVRGCGDCCGDWDCADCCADPCDCSVADGGGDDANCSCKC